MSQSEQINELAAALSKAQGEMQAAIKDKVNPFFKSSYADLGSVWDAARPVLSKHGLCVMQTTELTQDKIVMVTTLAHTSGQWVKSYLPLNPAKNDSQGVGAALTYLRRYSLSAIVGVVCDEDDDGETAMGRGKTTAKPSTPVESPKIDSPKMENFPKPEKVGRTQLIELDELYETLDKDSQKIFTEWLKKSLNVETLIDIPKNAFEKCLTSLNARIKYLRDQERTA